MKNSNKTYNIGVIAFNTDDFNYWKENNSLKHDGLAFKNKFKIKDNIYYCLTKSVDLCSKRFDGIIETDDSKMNKEYHEIKNILKTLINEQPR